MISEHVKIPIVTHERVPVVMVQGGRKSTNSAPHTFIHEEQYHLFPLVEFILLRLTPIMAEPPAPHVSQQFHHHPTAPPPSPTRHQQNLPAVVAVVAEEEDTLMHVVIEPPVDTMTTGIPADGTMDTNIHHQSSNGTVMVQSSPPPPTTTTNNTFSILEDSPAPPPPPVVTLPVSVSTVVPLPPPYVWDTTPERQPSADILHLWNEVGNGIDKSQTGMWILNVCVLLYVDVVFSAI
jgi:hypothetical protein